MSDWRRAVVLAALVLSGCDRADRTAPATPPPPPDSSITAAPVDSVAAASAAADTGLTAVVRRAGPDRFVVTGQTGTVQALELTLEDGHNILFGPAAVELSGGRFSIDVDADSSAQRVLSFYLTDGSGSRQWVIPFPVDSQQVRFGPTP